MTAGGIGLRRFLHLGPITALGIIKCITITTLYMNSMWWPPNGSIDGFLNQAIFLLLSAIATFNYIMATITGPGYLPFGWKPKKSSDVEYLQYCKVCNGYKAPRSHHCRKCNRCVKKMDHHCPWINNCVGFLNHAYFTYFLGFSIVGSFHAGIILVCSFIRGIHRYWYLTHGQRHLATVHFGLPSIIICIFAMGLSVGVVIALGMLLYFQLKTIITNQTGIEIWIVEKAWHRRNGPLEVSPFVFPYDLGKINNIRQVLNLTCLPNGDGIDWPVRAGCDQYTLTREQIAQKQLKRLRTKTFKCIRTATGHYFPIFSHGFRVSFSPPCTDEPRIKLIPGDIVKVTRFRPHWLFGVVDSGKENSLQRVGCIRGWFPRRCVIEIIEPEYQIDGDRLSDDDYNDDDVVLSSVKVANRNLNGKSNNSKFRSSNSSKKLI